ncbi:hypothetical protein [Methylocella sp.]|uniref:hypothetical protein n=1 Tax=Methylocella sp. TaxID=1978226 RepID=UPI0037843C90
MPSTRAEAVKRAEAVLSEALAPLVDELRLIDVADFIAFIRFERFANVRDLVESSSELFFEPGALRYAFDANYEADWASEPRVTLVLEFESAGVDVIFKLRIAATAYDVAIERHAAPDADPDRLAAQLAKALQDARLRR